MTENEKNPKNYKFNFNDFVDSNFSWEMKIASWGIAIFAVVGYLGINLYGESSISTQISTLETKVSECEKERIKLDEKLNSKENVQCIDMVKRCYPDLFVKAVFNK